MEDGIEILDSKIYDLTKLDTSLRIKEVWMGLECNDGHGLERHSFNYLRYQIWQNLAASLRPWNDLRSEV